MGQQGQVVGFERRVEGDSQNAYTKIDAGGGDVEEVQHLEAPGEDSPPIDGDFAAVEELGRSGSKHAVAYHDPKSPPRAQRGEKRLYCRTETGELVAELWMQHGEFHVEIFKTDVPFVIKSPGKVVVDSPDVNLGGEGGRPVATVGDYGAGAVRALCGAPGSPIIPVPPATPTPTGGVPVAVQIISGPPNVKARQR